jgi:hypothetical protein
MQAVASRGIGMVAAWSVDRLGTSTPKRKADAAGPATEGCDGSST